MGENEFLFDQAVRERLRAARADAARRALAREGHARRVEGAAGFAIEAMGGAPRRAIASGRATSGSAFAAMLGECGFAIAAKIVENARLGLMNVYRRVLLEG